MSSGPRPGRSPGRPCEPRTSESSGTTSMRYRKPRAFRRSFRRCAPSGAASPGRGRAPSGHSRACGGSPPCGRSPGPGAHRASSRSRTRVGPATATSSPLRGWSRPAARFPSSSRTSPTPSSPAGAPAQPAGRRGPSRRRGRPGGRRPRRRATPPGRGAPVERPVDAESLSARRTRLTRMVPRHLPDPVLGERDDLHAARAGGVDDDPRRGVHRPQGGRDLRGMGAEPLEVVVEVREVDQREVRPVGLDHLLGRAGDPAGRADPGARAPEAEERELPSSASSRSRRRGGSV